MTSPRDESPIATNSPPFSRQKVLIVFGTRPEAIKLCPLVRVLRTHASTSHLQAVVCVTAQHRQMLDQVLGAFEIIPDYDLDMMKPGQTLASLTARLLAGLEDVFAQVSPALTIVQGDTTTTMAGSLASFYARVPIAHVEAGLRTFDLQAPFPEEMNRVLTGRLASLHFPATDWAAENLLREGVPKESVQVTGNTGIDAVLSIRESIARGRHTGLSLPLDPTKKLIVVTAHRRESFGEGLAQICQSLADLAERPDVQLIWPVHPNPNVLAAAETWLRGKSNVTLIEPLGYLPFVDLMSRAYLLITDSGGVQEEGPSLGKPILVLRNKTERPEAVDAGTVKLVGTDRARIVREAEALLDSPAAYERMARLHNPYGDGKACSRIAERVAGFLAPIS